MRVICNFSAGVTSAVATKLALDRYGKDNCRIFFFETGQHHPDNERFIKECQTWFGKDIEVFQNQKYTSALDVCIKDKYVNGPSGARCTLMLKKKLRQKLETIVEYDGQVFGFEYDVKQLNRALRFSEQYPDAKPLYPLIEDRLTKEKCFEILEEVGIEIPAMYKLGYHNNNCIGCVKGGMGYWNKIRKDFPSIFKQTSDMERLVGHSCVKGTFLDELDPSRGNHKDLSFECGAFCQVETKGLKVFEDLEELRRKIIEPEDSDLL